MISKDFEVSNDVFTPRPYQLEILEKAKKMNVIVQLPTGSGKTYVAILLIKEVQYTVRQTVREGGKRIIFVVNSVALVEQQAKHIQNECELTVGELHGGSSINVNEGEKISEFLDNNQVIVLTAQILVDLLSHKRIDMENISLLIFDECHHSMGDGHPYSTILSKYNLIPNEKKPIILGLTASLFNSRLKKEKIEMLLRKLEYKMHSTIVTADDFSQIVKFSAKPTVKLVACENFDTRNFKISRDSIEFVEKLNNLLKELENCKATEYDNNYRQILTEGNIDITNALLEKNNGSAFKTVKKKIGEFFSISETLGCFGVYKVSPLWVSDLEGLRNNKAMSENSISLVESAYDVFDSIKVYHERVFSNINNFSDVIRYMPGKLVRTLEIIEAFNRKCKEEGSKLGNLSCIIFVERIVSAYAIFEILKALKKIDNERFGFIKADYIVGYGTTKPKELSISSIRVQDKKLHNFRQGNLNILVSTDVLEEGIDIRHCNLVIRFNFPKNFRSYVQGRGRVRHKEGIYILLSDTDHLEDSQNEWKNFEECEKLLIERFQTPNSPYEADDKKYGDSNYFIDRFYKPYVVEKTQACVSLSNSISLINRYCQKLPCDNFTTLAPTLEIIENDDSTYDCTLLLPSNCPHREVIRTKKSLPRKKFALMAAALEACKILHQIKELNDYLLPNGREKLKHIEAKFDDYEDDVELKERIVGSSQRKQLYDKKSSIYLYDILPIPGEDCYLYVFEINLTQTFNDCMNPKNRKVDNPYDYECAFGFLSKKIIPEMPGFPIFLRYGCAEVNVRKHSKKYNISEELWCKAKKFHEYIFSDILKVTDDASFSTTHAIVKIITLPLKKIKLESTESFDYEIDSSYINYILSSIENIFKQPSEEERSKYVFNESDYENAIVFPWYRLKESRNYYYIGEIMHDIRPDSNFPDNNYRTFEEYYLDKYKIEIKCKDQPLLDVDYTSSRLNILVPKYPPKSSRPITGSRSSQRQILVPELVSIHPIKSTHWFIIGSLPSIIYRYNCLLMAIKEALGRTNVYQGTFEPLIYKTSTTKENTKEKDSKVLNEENEETEVDITGFEIGVWDGSCVPTVKTTNVVQEPLNEFDSDAQAIRALDPNDEKMESDVEDVDHETIGTFRFLQEEEQIEIKQMVEPPTEPISLNCPTGWDDPNINNLEVRSVLHISDVDKNIDKRALVRDMNDINEVEDPEFLEVNYVSSLFKKRNVIDDEKTFVDLREYETSESPPPNISKDFSIHLKLDELEDLGSGWREIVRNNYELLIEAPQLSYKLDDDGIDVESLYSKGVNPAELLCALTSRGANDGINLERLETIGDSFLKFSTTDYLYHKYVNEDEGYLSSYRSREVSNMKLYFLGKKKNIHNIIINEKFEPHTNWVPPGYVVSSEFKPNYIQQNVDKEDKDAEVLLNCDFESEDKLNELCSGIIKDTKSKKKECNGYKFKKASNGNELSNIVYNPFLQQQICDKTIADAVEALIGCHLIYIGFNGTLKFMRWIGISVFSHNLEAVETDPLLRFVDTQERPNNSMERLYTLYKKNSFDIFEQKVKYVFRNKAYLIQAFSHVTFDNRVTGCYQRLEFLGDAVLDFVITRYLYSHEANFSPGTLTDLRSALVNNTMLASIAVMNDFHKYLMELNPALHIVIKKFVLFVKTHEDELINLHSDLFMANEEEEDCDGTEDIEVPKVLGDIFESFVGAVYLDSNRNLNVVWALIYGMMKEHLEKYTSEPPISPIRQLTESYPDKVQFLKMERDPNTQRVKVYVEVFGAKITGGGRNFKIAKCNAAKRALKYIKQLEKERSKNKNILQ
uniref:RNA helicase n=1 Tax=Parastrongyloides trichosuri TaxID=131310 RepID=A0A0N4ZYI6_PARTI